MGWAIPSGPIAIALADARAHKTRTEHGDTNAERSDLQRQSLRHGNHRKLARRIWAKAEITLQPRHGGGVDDMASFPMRLDMRQESANAMEDPEHVHVKHPAPGFERDIVDAAASGDTSVVADDVDVSEGVVAGLGRVFDACGVSYVADDALYMLPGTSKVFDSGRQCINLDIGEHHVHTHCRKGVAKSKSYPARPTCDECRLACEFSHDSHHNPL